MEQKLNVLLELYLGIESECVILRESNGKIKAFSSLVEFTDWLVDLREGTPSAV